MNNRLVLILLCLVLSMSAKAQLTGLWSQYMVNGLIINPAYAGTKGHTTLNLNYRNQWAGFEGSPVTQALSGHGTIKRQPISFGGMLIRETIGVSRDLGFTAMSAYKLKMRKGNLQFGLGMGFRSRRANWTEVNLDTTGDELFIADGQSMMRPEFSFGTYYHNKKMYFGYSIPTLLGYGYATSDRFSISMSPLEMNHLITAGFSHEFSRDLVLKPSFLLKAVPNSAMQFDLNATFILQNKFWIGASYRFSESFFAMFEYQMNNQMRVGYAYDHQTIKIGQFSGGSHELMLIYEFRQNSFAKNPRYF